MKKGILLKTTIIFFTLVFSINAQFYFFGRNKIQYNDFNWKVIKTEHFDIYHYEEFSELAEIGAKFAEDAYDDLKIKFNHVPVIRIPLIFYNTHLHFQQTNTTPGFIPEGVGGFFEFMKGRVVIPFLGSIPGFKNVIKHELVHVFMTNKIYNVLSDHRVATNKFPPLWFIEGLAEYWSSDWDTQSEMVIRDAVLNGYFVPYNDLDRIAGTYLMYKEGEVFLQFISKEYGEDKILKLMENLWKFAKFNEIIEFTLDEDIDIVAKKWEFELKRKYYPLYETKFPHLIKSKKLTENGFTFSPNVFSHDNEKYIIYIGNYNGYTSLYKIKINNDSKELEEPELLIKGEIDSRFESFHAMDNSLDVSKNGIAAFVTKSGQNDAIHIYSLIDNKIISKLDFDKLITIKSPSFSEGGSKITFSAIDEKGYPDIYVYELNTHILERITNDIYEDIDPIFKNDGSGLIFCSDRTAGKFKGKMNLFEFDYADNTINYLTNIDANISTPHYSPSGELYFTSDYNDIYNIWKLDEDKLVKKTNFVTSVYDFGFIDSTKIITAAFESFTFHLYETELNEGKDEEIKSIQFVSNDERWYPLKIKLESQNERINYKNDYSLDYAVSQIITDPIYGTRGGALFTLSDLLGNDKYLFYLYNTAEVQSDILKSFNLSLSKINLKGRTNYAFGVFNYSGRRYDIRESDSYYYEKVYGGFFDLIFPISVFSRVEMSNSIANSDKDLIGDIITRKSLLISNAISYVHDNTLWGPTGPMDGNRYRVLLGYTSDVRYSNVNFYSFIADYRHYLRLDTRTSLALRGSVYINHGKEARRYFAGGSWDLRGWPRFKIRGEKLWLSSMEYRFPLIDQFVIKFPFIGIGFFNIRGALFMDAGGAWDNEYKETLGSIGAGIRLNFLNSIVFRYDVGKKIENNFNSFQPGLFYQFFFGVDF